MQIELTFDPKFDNLYRKYLKGKIGGRLLDIEGISPEYLDIGRMCYNYFSYDLSDVSVDKNANRDDGISPTTYQSEVAKPLIKLEAYYLLWKYAAKRWGVRCANELVSAMWDGHLYFHDISAVNKPYCFGYSTTFLMNEGRPYGQLYAKPPKRADSFVAQVIETTMDLSQEYAGAINPADMIVNYAWYAKKEGLDDYRILNDLQKFVHVINNKFRVSGDSPFVNLSLFDRPNLKKVFGEHIYPDGSKIDVEYIMHIQKLFGEWFAKGDPVSGLPYRFPVCTVNLYVNENKEIVDRDFLEWVSKTNIERGIFNIYVNDGQKLSMCCRLSPKFGQMKYRADSFGNGGVNVGSHRVVTVNLPRIALEAQGDEKLFYKLLARRLEQAKKLLIVHREEILRRRIEQGFLKFYKPLKWFNLQHLFSTIGIIGVYECNYFMNHNINSEKGISFTTSLLEFIERKAQEYSDELKYSFNVEEIPGETAAVSLCEKDKLFYPWNPFRLYSNQYIPLIAEADVIDRIKLSGKFMSLVSGGGILHINVQDKLKSPEQMGRIIELAVKYGVEHFAINYGFGICKNNHVTIVGNKKYCPICNEDIVDHMTRIVGYFTRVTSWNKVREEYEFPRRVFKDI